MNIAAIWYSQKKQNKTIKQTKTTTKGLELVANVQRRDDQGRGSVANRGS